MIFRMRMIVPVFLLALLACDDAPDSPEPPGPSARPPPPGISGIVLDDREEPVAGVTVKVHIPVRAGYRGWKEGLTTLTDVSGDFHLDVDGELRPSGPTPVFLFAEKEGHERFVDRIPSYLPGRGIRIRVPLPRGGRVTGRVLAEGGGAVEGALVYALPDTSLGVEREDGAPHARTDTDGRYRIDGLGAGLWVVGARAPGTLPAVSAPLEVVREGEHAAPDLVLVRGASIRGRVVDPTGEPVTGATVRAWRSENLKELRLFGASALEDAGGTALTGPDGGFEIRGLAQDGYTIEAEALGHRAGAPAPSGIEPGTTDLRIVLVPGAKIELTARNAATGDPVPAFAVAVSWSPGEQAQLSVGEEIAPPEDGFRFAVLPGTDYWLEVSAPGYEVATRELRVVDDTPRQIVVPLFPR
jgi:hypothetical protein